MTDLGAAQSRLLEKAEGGGQFLDPMPSKRCGQIRGGVGEEQAQHRRVVVLRRFWRLTEPFGQRRAPGAGDAEPASPAATLLPVRDEEPVGFESLWFGIQL